MTDSKAPPSSDQDDLPDYSLLFQQLNTTLVLDEEERVCNPAVFHPTQEKLVKEALERSLHYPEPKQKTKNAKEQCLMRGAQRARMILHERRNIVAKTAKRIDTTSNLIMKTGLCFSMIHPLLGAPLLGAGLGMHYLNKHIAAKGQKKLDLGLNALAICTNKEIANDKKAEACEQLKEAEKHIRYWEKTRSVTTTVVKFAFGEMHGLVSGAQLLLDVKNNTIGKPKKTEVASSESLRGALSQVYHGMDLKKPKPHQAISFIASPEF